jgi:hypothetical protein
MNTRFIPQFSLSPSQTGVGKTNSAAPQNGQTGRTVTPRKPRGDWWVDTTGQEGQAFAQTGGQTDSRSNCLGVNWL